MNLIQFTNKMCKCISFSVQFSPLKQKQNREKKNINQMDKNLQTHIETNKKNKQYKAIYSLLGDVGGTNIRFQLVLIQPPHNEPVERVKKQTYPVEKHDNFQGTIQKFLAEVPKQKYPEVAVIGVAGPVEDNKVFLSNVEKWGQLAGEKLSESLQIRHFVFLNDFIAISHGLTMMPQQNFVLLNGLHINPKHVRGVLGPGTGLGNSIIFSAPFRKRERIYILPSEGGHCDSPYINETVGEYYQFLGQKLKVKSVGLEYSFCGPAIPYMYQFLASKYPNLQGAEKTPTSHEIIKQYKNNKQGETLWKKTVDLFIDLYCSAICNHIIAHMCTGGLYLVGSLTNEVIERLKETKITQKYSQRHPEMKKLINKVPIVVSKEVDMGLIGAYVYARRIIADQQHE